MFKSTFLTILAATALVARAEYNIQFALGPDVKMMGFNSTQRIMGPAFFANPVGANFSGIMVNPFWLSPSGNQTADCLITLQGNQSMGDDRLFVFQAVPPYWPITNNGPVQMNCTTKAFNQTAAW